MMVAVSSLSSLLAKRLPVKTDHKISEASTGDTIEIIFGNIAYRSLSIPLIKKEIKSSTDGH